MSRLLPFRTLRGRLTMLAALTTLPAFLFVIYIAGKERGDALRRAESEARYVASLASREHATQVTGARRVLERLAAGSDTQDGPGALPSLLPAILAGFPQIANLWIVTRDGELAYSVIPPPQHVVVRDNPVFSAALHSRTVVIGRYQVGPIVGRPVLLMARALRTAGGAPHHVLIAALELSWLDQLARQSGLPPRSALVIADGSGRILAGATGTIDGFDAMTANPAGMRPTRIGGVDRLAVAVPLAGVPELWVVAGPPRRDVYAMANRIFMRDTAVLALLAFFAVGVSLLTTDVSVLRDLRLLDAATRRFAEGDLRARVPLPRPAGELRDLAAAFNAMAEALERRQHDAAAAQERLRALSERLSAVREEEAARIAQELHDQLGQELTVLKFEMESLRRGIRSGENADASIDRLEARVDTAVETVRRISSELRPGVLDRLGLVAGLEWLLREFERHSGITTDLAAENGVEPVAPSVATALFRITQESLTNVARHANASLVELRLRNAEDQVELRFHDDGRGFDPRSVSERPSLGLLGIEERARRLGGTAIVESAPGEGTTVVVRLPREAD